MRRAHFLDLTGQHDDRFKSLCRRGLVPFAVQTGTENRWGKLDYSPLRAALMIAFNQLAASGLSAETASAALFGREQLIAAGPVVDIAGAEKGHVRSGRVFDRVFPTTDVGADVWVGFLVGDDDEKPTFVYNTLAEIAKDVWPIGASMSSRLIVVNLTNAIRHMRRRAAAIGDAELIGEVGQVTEADDLPKG